MFKNREILLGPRNTLSKQIRSGVRYIQEEIIFNKAKELEKNKGNRRFFKALKLLRISKYKPLTIQDETNTRLQNKNV